MARNLSAGQGLKSRGRSQFLSVLAVALVFFSVPAAAANLDLATSRLISAGKFEEAKALLLRSDATEADKLFLDARILKALKKLDRALLVFREVIRLQPSHLNARRELAHTLLLSGRLDAAEHHFERLIEVDPNTTMRGGYRNFLRMIDQAQPFGVSLIGALLPSTNVNRGSIEDTIQSSLGTGSISSQKESGIGARLGVRAHGRHSFANGHRVSANASISATKYTAKEYDSLFGVMNFGYQRNLGDLTLSASPFARYTMRREGSHDLALGASLSADYRLNGQSSLGATFSYEERSYRLSERQDGPYSRGDLNYRRRFGEGFSLRLGLSAEQRDPEIDYQRYRGLGAHLALNRSWKGGLFTELRAEVTSRRYRADFPFSLPLSPRKDRAFKIGSTIYDSRVTYLGFLPKLNCSYQLQDSNIAFYVYDAIDCQVSVTRRF